MSTGARRRTTNPHLVSLLRMIKSYLDLWMYMVPPEGFEPYILALRGLRPEPD